MPSKWDQYAAPAAGSNWEQYASEAEPPAVHAKVPEPEGLQGKLTYGEYLHSISTPQSAIDLAEGVGKGVLGTIAASNPMMTRGVGSGGDLVNTDASNQAQKAGKIVEGGAELAIPAGELPSAAHAGGVLGDVTEAANNVRVPLSKVTAPLQRVTELGERGGTLPTSANALLKRTQMLGDMTFPEARDYYSNISSLSADDANKLSPVMKRAVGAMKAGFHGDLTEAANQVGMGDEYANAMKEYANAMKLRGAGQAALKYALPAGGVLGGLEWLRHKVGQ